MAEAFVRPKGAHADIAELEYISILHQSSFETRPAGYITAFDVKSYLVSRHGIHVSEEEVLKSIVQCFGSGTNDYELIDLTEMIAMILIPYFLKLSCDVLPEKKAIQNSFNSKTDSEDDHTFQQSDETDSELEKGKQQSSILSDILSSLLLDATENPNPQKLTVQLLQTIFLSFGEVTIAENESLLRDMISSLTHDNKKKESNLMLNEENFIRAIISDVQLYDIHNDKSLTTCFYDVFHINPNGIPIKIPKSSNEEGQKDEQQIQVKFMASSIDNQADLAFSQLTSVLLWISLIFTYAAYLFNYQDEVFHHITCYDVDIPFFCFLLKSLVIWVTTLIGLSVFGTFYICYANLGNGRSKSILSTLVAMLTVICCNILPFFMRLDKYILFITRNWDKTVTGSFIMWTSFILGCFILLLQVYSFSLLLIPKRILELHPTLQKLAAHKSVKYELYMKQAGTFKVQELIKNAHILHELQIMDNYHHHHHHRKHDMVLQNYIKNSKENELVGGVIWTFRRLFNGTMFTQEGIWYSSRLRACLFAIFLTFIMTILLAIDLCNLEILDKSLHWCTLTGCSIGAFTCIRMTILFLPSVTSTVLQYRCGFIPTLKDKNFFRLRLATDTTARLLPSIFWGQYYSSLSISFSFSLFFYLLALPRLTVYSQAFLAQMLSFIITITIPWAVFRTIRKNIHAGFFRTSPWLSNFLHCFQTSWHIGTSVGFMFFRGIKLLFIAMLFIGRLDVDFLGSNVGNFGPFEIENMPNSFKKDILVHDAHRHPYMEILGLMYMMKLKHGKEFGNSAGSCWRLLFVFALMPWSRKYRLMNRPELRKNHSLFDSSDASGLAINELKKYNYSDKKPSTSSKENNSLEKMSSAISIDSNDEDYQSLIKDLEQDLVVQDEDVNSKDIQKKIQYIDEQIKNLMAEKDHLENELLENHINKRKNFA